MNLVDFREEFIDDLNGYAIANMYTTKEAFFYTACDLIASAGEIREYNECFYEGRGKYGKNIILDGYYFDDFRRELNLIICDFNTKNASRDLGIPEIRNLVSQSIAFLDNREDIMNHAEESSLGFQFADWLKYMWAEIKKIRVIVLSTENTKRSVKNIKSSEIDDKEVYYNVWGIERLYEIYNSPNADARITIDLEDYVSNGIPALKASDAEVADYSSYLAVISGKILAELYDEYGAKLLEGNVRSFLSYRGKVNKSIRETLLKRPHMFFAFNNGIAATASSIETQVIDGKTYIKQMTDFQIVNGGQTTASIFNVKHVRKEADLEGVYVPMKLNVVENEKIAEKLIPIIAETANTQNKVNKADFFANSGFHRRVENIANNLFAPTVEGNQYRTKWFYERARGSYEAKLLSFKTSEAQRKQFILQNPKGQRIKKTDLAKYFNSIYGRPDRVSKGAQTNFVLFANQMDIIWKKNPDIVNKEFYKKIVVGAIIFKYLEKLVSSSPWYQNAFRANIVTYTISYFFNKIEKQDQNVFDYDFIWREQSVPNDLSLLFDKITYAVFEEISREVQGRTKNVTEWCKKEECWIEVKKNIDIDVIPYTRKYMVSKEDAVEKEKEGQKEQKEINKLDTLVQVVSFGDEFWQSVLDFGVKNKKLFAMEFDLIKLASSIHKTGKTPSEKQAKIIMKTLSKLKSEGFKGNDDF